MQMKIILAYLYFTCKIIAVDPPHTSPLPPLPLVLRIVFNILHCLCGHVSVLGISSVLRLLFRLSMAIRLAPFVKLDYSNFKIILIPQSCESKKRGKDQESIQSSTTPDPGFQWERDNFTRLSVFYEQKDKIILVGKQ